jgi:hypothetical protein
MDWNTLDEFIVVLHLNGNHFGTACISRKDSAIDLYDSIPGYVDGMEILNVWERAIIVVFDWWLYEFVRS